MKITSKHKYKRCGYFKILHQKNDKNRHGGLILGSHDQFQHLSWGFVDQVTDNIQIEKKEENFDIFSSRVVSLLIVTASSYEWPTVFNTEEYLFWKLVENDLLTASAHV